MEADAIVILLLKSLAINYPVLRSWGHCMPRLITLLVSPGYIARVLDLLTIFPHRQKKSSKNSDFDFHFFPSGKDCSSQKAELALACNIDTTGANGLKVVVTDSQIIDDSDAQSFYILMDSCEDVVKFGIKEFVPDRYELDAIKGRIRKYIEGNDFSAEEEVFIAAAFFLEPFLLKKNVCVSLDEVLDVAESLYLIDEKLRESNEFENYFKTSLQKWLSSQDRSHYVDLVETHENQLLPEDEGVVNDCIFFDGKFMFLKEQTFKRMLAEMQFLIPVNLMKMKLRDSGVLVANRTSTYSVKMCFKDCYGREHSPRMLRFDLGKLSNPGELNLRDQCLLGGKNYE